MSSDVIKPDLHRKTRPLSPCSLVLQRPVVRGSAGPCSHQGRAPVTSARNGSHEPGVWVTENYVPPCQRTLERNTEAGEVKNFLEDILPVPWSFEVRAVLSVKLSNQANGSSRTRCVRSSGNLSSEAEATSFLIRPRGPLGALQL